MCALSLAALAPEGACAQTKLSDNPDAGGPAMILPDHSSALYKVGEPVTFTIQWPDGKPPAAATYTITYGGLTQLARGNVNISGPTATVSGGTFTKPGSRMIEVDWTGMDGKPLQAFGGGTADPEKIEPGAPPPPGFEAFWAAKVRELAAVPMDPQLTPEPSGADGVYYSKIMLRNIRGTHVDGQIARPVKGRSFPAIVRYQWAGVYGLQKPWVTDFAKQGYLALDIEAHDIPIDKPDDYYQKLSAGSLHNYWEIGNDDPNQSYYLRMYMGCYRAIEYIRHRPDWNGKVLVVSGDSQGGQQSLIAAAMHPSDVTAILVDVPAACDVMAPDIGRSGGFPNWYNNVEGKDPAKVRLTGRFYDPANFAPMIRCPILVGVPMRDIHTSPPDSIFATMNRIKAPKEEIVMPRSGHEPNADTQQPFNDAMYGRWLPALAKGLPAPLAATNTAASP